MSAFFVYLKLIIMEERKQQWLELQAKVFDSGLLAEFAEFYLENPGLSIEELDRQFSIEWDI